MEAEDGAEHSAPSGLAHVSDDQLFRSLERAVGSALSQFGLLPDV